MKKKLCGGKILQKIDGELQLVKSDLYFDNEHANLDGLTSKYEEIDISGMCLVLPFFNLHSHLGESLYFKYITGKNWDITKYLKYTEEIMSNLSKKEKDIFWEKSAKIAAQDMKKYGTLGFCAARSTKIAREFGFLTMSGYPIMNSKKLLKFKEEGVEGFLKFYNENNDKDSLVGVFLHSVYANDEDSFKLALDCMELGAKFLTVHVSEDYDTYQLEKKIHGMSAIEVLEKYGLLNEKTILVHCGYCNEQDLELIKKREAIICVCPISNKFLNTKMPNLYLLEEKKIKWCICSDGLATGRTFSLLEQVKEARKKFPLIPLERYIDSIIYTPLVYFKDKYQEDIKNWIGNIFLVVDYDGDNIEEILDRLINGSLTYQLRSY